MTEMSTGALQAWLNPSDDPYPRNGVPAPRGNSNAHPDPSGPAEADLEIDPDTTGELLEMRRDLALLRGKAALQRDPAWLDVLSTTEETRERAAAEKIRGMRRDQHVSTATAAVGLAGRECRAEARLARYELTDRVWQRRALARRTRLLDPTSRLAALQRTHVLTTAVLLGLAAAGIGWTSVGVHDALVGSGGSPLAYVVEPLFSLPLLVVMALHARAAQWGRTFPAAEHRRKVVGLEAGLLAATVLVNSAGVLPGLGVWRDTTTLLAHLAPPVLILVAVLLQPLVASFLAEILADAHVDAADPGGRRLDGETVDMLSLVAKVRRAITGGELAVRAETGQPSTEAIRRFFSCEKRRAQGVSDALALLDLTPPAGYPASDGPAGELR